MKWRTGGRSSSVADRRGMRPEELALRGGGLGMIVMVPIGLYLAIAPAALPRNGPQDTQRSPAAEPSAAAPDDPLAEFVAVVLGDIEDTWRALFEAGGGPYQAPRLVLFSDAV
jgi:predicted metalloprotease